jgi:hypothetical protein
MHYAIHEDTQFNLLGVRRKQGEIDACAIPVRPERPWPPFLQAGIYA